jgi:hypothetical protein
MVIMDLMANLLASLTLRRSWVRFLFSPNIRNLKISVVFLIPLVD